MLPHLIKYKNVSQSLEEADYIVINFYFQNFFEFQIGMDC